MILNCTFCFILFFGINGGYGFENTQFTSKSDEHDDDKAEELAKGKEHIGKKEEVMHPAQVDWPQGIVPYYVDPKSYDDVITTRIRMAMNTIESLSCIMFKEIPMMPPEFAGFKWLYITNPESERDCRHTTFVGSKGNVLLILGYDCLKRRDIIHALFHVLGFNDEVTHPQRDMYVRILWQNIQPRYRPLFRISTDEQPHKMMVEYDTLSIMHFHDRAYSSNGGATIAPLISGLLISPAEKLSQLDIMKLRLAFGHECNRRKVGNLVKTCENVLQNSDNEKPYLPLNNNNQEEQEEEEQDDHEENGDVGHSLESKLSQPMLIKPKHKIGHKPHKFKNEMERRNITLFKERPLTNRNFTALTFPEPRVTRSLQPW
ncbi:low choriolytic enzyme-like [Trichoplusia ni]|uniref:Metalloendopeptidase n=1 Tax=Trichoplusia ni TaxID=7111 RepID=A0A7E5VGS3_TRINI|nr:low choriolytic enzyme-like [Trichoplusia ni]